MRTLAGPGSEVLFTAVPQKLVEMFSESLSSLVANSEPAGFKISPTGILHLLQTKNIPLEKICLLDPKAESQLAPEDGDGRFTHFLIGVRIPFF